MNKSNDELVSYRFQVDFVSLEESQVLPWILEAEEFVENIVVLVESR